MEVESRSGRDDLHGRFFVIARGEWFVLHVVQQLVEFIQLLQRHIG